MKGDHDTKRNADAVGVQRRRIDSAVPLAYKWPFEGLAIPHREALAIAQQRYGRAARFAFVESVWHDMPRSQMARALPLVIDAPSFATQHLGEQTASDEAD